MDAEDPLPDAGIEKYHRRDNGILVGIHGNDAVFFFFAARKSLILSLRDGLLPDEATKKAEPFFVGSKDAGTFETLYMIFFTRRAHEQFRIMRQWRKT
jgi:hypothetical protein